MGASSSASSGRRLLEELVVRFALCPPFPVVKFVSVLPPFRGAKLFVNSSANVVALTLDDGPDAALTPLVLGVLEKYQARATFFLLGEAAERSQRTVDAIVAGGHEIANHTCRDERSTSLKDDELRASLAATHAVLTADERLASVRLFRPGGGLPGWTGRMARIAREPPHNYSTVLASIYPHDVRIENEDVIVRGILRRVRPGGIIALHEGATPPRQPDRHRVLAVLEEILRTLRARSFKVVTASTLLSLEGSGTFPVERAGIEPATSALQTRRSPS
jgi:peptidoglycan/xylan/chitin deacetylase (PgdA/CDA1 family)